MSGKKGIAAHGHLRARSRKKRGGNVRTEVEFPRGDPENLAGYADAYLEWMAVRRYSPISPTRSASETGACSNCFTRPGCGAAS